jgi:hypothetical protein
MRRFRGRGTAPLAVIALAVILTVSAVCFGLVALLTSNPAQFARLTALSGVFSVVLAAFAAAGTMTVWAISQRRGTADDGSEGHRPRHPARLGPASCFRHIGCPGRA